MLLNFRRLNPTPEMLRPVYRIGMIRITDRYGATSLRAVIQGTLRQRGASGVTLTSTTAVRLRHFNLPPAAVHVTRDLLAS